MLDDTTIAIPERPGNRRVDGYRNVLANPHVGLIFLIPGRGDTLRINGRARLVADAPFFDAMVVKGHRPLLALVVEIEEIFHHCAKAFLRSRLWQPETWSRRGAQPRPVIAKALERPEASLEELTATTARRTPRSSTASSPGSPSRVSTIRCRPIRNKSICGDSNGSSSEQT